MQESNDVRDFNQEESPQQPNDRNEQEREARLARQSNLLVQLRDPDVQRLILADYPKDKEYALGVIADPEDPSKFIFEIEIEGDDRGNIPLSIRTLDDQEIKVEVAFNFKVPRPLATNRAKEANHHRPLVYGLQIQNIDLTSCEAGVKEGKRTVGTLGCFVELPGKGLALLSNAHVLAARNNGEPGRDRIIQHGGLRFLTRKFIGTLENFIPIHTRDTGKRNSVDAAVALLDPTLAPPPLHGYLGHHTVPPPQTYGPPLEGDKVYKVGAKTGLTYGVIRKIGSRLPINYPMHGKCDFDDYLEIEGDDIENRRVGGKDFSAAGDSGAVVVRYDGEHVEIVGLLFAESDDDPKAPLSTRRGYACPIEKVFELLGCTYVP